MPEAGRLGTDLKSFAARIMRFFAIPPEPAMAISLKRRLCIQRNPFRACQTPDLPQKSIVLPHDAAQSDTSARVMPWPGGPARPGPSAIAPCPIPRLVGR